MDFTKYLSVLLMILVEGGESGGHGEKHYDHVKLRVPEFHHHDFHTKVITIHHHHQKPKKEQHHHHHHHHHHKPQIPQVHNYHHHHTKKSTSHTESKGHHRQHGHHEHSGNHGHHSQQGHQPHHVHHNHGSHHDIPSVSIDSGSSFETDFGSAFVPSVPSYASGIPQIPQVHHSVSIPQVPHVTGIQHTVKQVKVFDSLPGSIPHVGTSNGYEVTEEGEEDDTFTSINNLQNSYPATFGYVQSAASAPSHDPFTATITGNSFQSNNHDPFLSAPAPVFSASVQNDPFSSSVPESNDFAGGQSAPDFGPSFHSQTGFDDSANSFSSNELGDMLFLSEEEKINNDETPVTFSRQAGIQQSVNTRDVESVVYK